MAQVWRQRALELILVHVEDLQLLAVGDGGRDNPRELVSLQLKLHELAHLADRGGYGAREPVVP